MRYRKLSPTGDYTFGSGQANFYKDSPEAVAQSVQTRLLLWVDEWYLDITEGTPYIQGILGKQPQNTVDDILRSRILDTQGVSSIISYQSIIDPVERTLSVSGSLDTIYGTTTFQAAI